MRAVDASSSFIAMLYLRICLYLLETFASVYFPLQLRYK